jgi:hypothetical protein
VNEIKYEHHYPTGNPETVLWGSGGCDWQLQGEIIATDMIHSGQHSTIRDITVLMNDIWED